MKFNVSDIEFDYKNDKLTFDEEIAVRDLALGVYEADDDNDLLDEITATTGYDIVNIYYEVQLKWLNSLLLKKSLLVMLT